MPAHIPNITRHALYGEDFRQFLAYAQVLKNDLEANNNQPLERGDFLHLLRPFYWYVHEPMFEDIKKVCVDAYTLALEHYDRFEGNTNFNALCSFITAYINEESLDAGVWHELASSVEIAAAVSAEDLYRTLAADEVSEEKRLAFAKFAETFRVLDGAKQTVYWCLRAVAADFLDELDIMHTFSPDDQAIILQALDDKVGDESVIAFYRTYMEETSNAELRSQAEKYLERLSA